MLKQEAEYKKIIKDQRDEIKQVYQERGYDVGTSLDTLGFQKDSLQIDLDFFVHMKKVYIEKLYGDLFKYCSNSCDHGRYHNYVNDVSL